MRPCKPSLAYPSEAKERLRGFLCISWVEDGPEERSADVSLTATATGNARDDNDDDKPLPGDDGDDNGDNGDLDLNIDDVFEGSSRVSMGNDLRLRSSTRKLSSAIGDGPSSPTSSTFLLAS